jgi:hypothetical protein
MDPLQTLLDSLKDAAWSGHGAVIGAGRYSPQNCKALAAEIEQITKAAPAMLAALQRADALLHELRAHELDGAEDREAMAAVAVQDSLALISALTDLVNESVPTGPLPMSSDSDTA